MILRDVTEMDVPAAAVFEFFEEMEAHYTAWHPDHVLFRWVRGRGLTEGNVFYFEEFIGGKLLKKKVRFTRVVPDEHMEFAPTFWLMRLFLPRLLFRIEALPLGGCRVIAENHMRIGPLAARLNRRELDAVRDHMRIEGVNLRRIVEARGAQ